MYTAVVLKAATLSVILISSHPFPVSHVVIFHTAKFTPSLTLTLSLSLSLSLSPELLVTWDIKLRNPLKVSLLFEEHDLRNVVSLSTNCRILCPGRTFAIATAVRIANFECFAVA
jgi:hypothetical protein